MGKTNTRRTNEIRRIGYEKIRASQRHKVQVEEAANRYASMLKEAYKRQQVQNLPSGYDMPDLTRVWEVLQRMADGLAAGVKIMMAVADGLAEGMLAVTEAFRQITEAFRQMIDRQEGEIQSPAQRRRAELRLHYETEKAKLSNYERRRHGLVMMRKPKQQQWITYGKGE